MKSFLKALLVFVVIVAAIVAALFINRATERVVITNKPAEDLNVLNLEIAGATQADPDSWANLSAILKEPAALWDATAKAAGGRGAQPADWPEGYTWPYDCQDALRTEAPPVVKQAARQAVDSLRQNGFFDRLAKAREGPAPVFVVHSSETESLLLTTLPDLGFVRTTARHQALRMAMAVERGDENDFLNAVRDNFFIARASSQCFLIGTLVNFAVDALTFAEIRHAVHGHTLSPQTLASLDEILRTVVVRPAMKGALRSERLAQQDMIQRVFSDDGSGNGHYANKSGMIGLVDSAGGLPSGPLATLASYVMADRKETEQAFDALLSEALEQIDAKSIPDFNPGLDNFTQRYSKVKFPFVHILAPALGSTINATLSTEADLNATRIIIALERYRVERGSIAPTLEALVPAYMLEIPRDSISGKPWVYKVLPATDEHARQYLLYSVGVDGKDDGGTHSESARKRSADAEGSDYVYTRPRLP